jgi:hypothetical protein
MDKVRQLELPIDPDVPEETVPALAMYEALRDDDASGWGHLVTAPNDNDFQLYFDRIVFDNSDDQYGRAKEILNATTTFTS